jgi:hypothetical protein
MIVSEGLGLMAKRPRPYDANVLLTYIEELYRRAKWIIVARALKYGIAAFVIGMFVINVVPHTANLFLFVCGATFVAALIGMEKGRAKAWEYKFEAQKLLLEIQIEANTRGAPTAATAAFAGGQTR